MNNIIKSWLPVIIWAIIIFLFSANSDPHSLLPEVWRALRPLPQLTNSSLPELISQFMHFIEFAILAFLQSHALYHGLNLSRKSILTAILLTTLFAFSDEIHQLFIPGRTFQVIDLFIDLLGAICGVFLYKKMTYTKPN